MYIYFIAAVSALDELRGHYKGIISFLESEGHSVEAGHILGKDNTSNKGYFSQIKQKINVADMVVAELSFPTTNVGHEIAYALEQNKPVLGLYAKETSIRIKPLLVGNSSDTIIIQPYSLGTLEENIGKGLREVQSNISEKFSFTISPRISDYLNWVSKKRRIPRSVYLRSLIEEKLRKDKTYEKDWQR